MKLVEVQELSGPALDWAVAKCEGKNGVLHDDGITRCIVIAAPSGVYKGRYTPTVNWAQGGPIIEGEGISTMFHDHDHWTAANLKGTVSAEGPTPLIAAMRCYCCATLGDEVDIPQELQPCQQPNL
mgnify:CR=1 FL=1